MWCAVCGKPLQDAGNGATAQCCGGLGYWADREPLPADRWWPTTKRNGLTFYPSGKWPEDKKPTPPAEA